MLFPTPTGVPFPTAAAGHSALPMSCPARPAFVGLNLLARLPPESDDELLERAQILADAYGSRPEQSWHRQGPRQGPAALRPRFQLSAGIKEQLQLLVRNVRSEAF